MDKIYDYLKEIDLYGYEFPLRYKKEKEYSTLCGIFFSIISISLTIYLIILYTTQIINRTNFSLVTNYIYSEKPLEINVSNLPLMIGLYNYDYSMNINKSYVKIKMYQNFYTPILDNEGYSILNRTSHSIELEDCNTESFGKYIQLFDKYDYRKNICLKQDQELSIKGHHGDHVRGYNTIEIHLIKCTNSTLNNNSCKSDDEIEEYLQNTWLSLIYLSQTINHYDYSFPIQNSLRSDAFVIASQHVKRYYHFFSKEKYISDNGLIFGKFQNYDLFQYHHTHFDFIEKELQGFYSNQTLIEINFTCMDLETKYNRIYMKIQDVFGDLGGLLDILSIIFKLLSSNFVKKSFVLGIGNSFIFTHLKKIEMINKSNGNLSFSNKSILKTHQTEISCINKNKNIRKTKINNYLNFIGSNIQSNIMNILQINNNNLNKIMKDKKKKKNNLYYFNYFICPFFILKIKKKYHMHYVCVDMFKKLMSIDVLIPMILHSYQYINR
jgi:hypothetical protein